MKWNAECGMPNWSCIGRVGEAVAKPTVLGLDAGMAEAGRLHFPNRLSDQSDGSD